MSIYNTISELQTATEGAHLQGVTDFTPYAQRLLDILRSDAEHIQALNLTNPLPTSASLDKLTISMNDRAKRVAPSSLGAAMVYDVQQRRLQKTIDKLQKEKETIKDNPDLTQHLEEQLKSLNNKLHDVINQYTAFKANRTPPFSDADQSSIDQAFRENYFDEDIEAFAEQQTHLCLLANPGYAQQREAISDAYKSVTEAVKDTKENGSTVDFGFFSNQLINLKAPFPPSSKRENEVHGHILNMQADIPFFSVRTDVPEVAAGNLRDEDIPYELFELESRLAKLQSLVTKRDALHNTIFGDFATTDEKEKALQAGKAVNKELAHEFKAQNKFLKRHAHGALKAVDPQKMKAIIKGHRRLANGLGYQPDVAGTSNAKATRDLFASIYLSLLQPLDVFGHGKRLYDVADNFLELNSTSRHLPSVGTSSKASGHEISFDPNYLKKNDSSSFTTTCKFYGRTTDKNRKIRAQLTDLFNSKDFQLPPNPPNSNDPAAQRFSTRQALLDEFGEKWVRKNVKSRADGGIKINFKNDNEAAQIYKVLAKRNEEYLKWKQDKNLSATLHGKPDKNETLQASLGGKPQPNAARPAALAPTPSAPPAAEEETPEAPSHGSSGTADENDPDPTTVFGR